MKLIDLLNKIANGEEVPKKIRFNDIEWEYNKPQYERVDKKDRSNLWTGYNFRILDDEVEIIEEEKKIPEKLKWHEENGVGNDDDAFYVDVNGKSQYVDSEYDSWEMTVILKINEIIDFLKSKGE